MKGGYGGRLLAVVAALLGWMFDGMEMGLFPLVGRDALRELLAEQGDQSRLDLWYGVVLAGFLVGAATGGVVFGYLGDKFGRVRAMTLSILMYSLCSGLSAAAQSPVHLAVLRFLGALGMGGEWALGVALVMELWPGASRVLLAGLIGAFGNLGYTICGSIAYLLNHTDPVSVQQGLMGIGLPPPWATALTAHRYWRLLFLVGAVPALLTVLIRLLVPESDKWEQERAAGRSAHWSESDLFGVLTGAVAACGVIALWAVPENVLSLGLRLIGSAVGLVLVVAGYLYPARGYLLRSGLSTAQRQRVLGRMLLGAGLSGVPLLGTWAGLMWMYMWVSQLPGGDVPDARPMMQIVSSVAAALGCFIGALISGVIGRRAVYAALCLLSLAAMVGFYRYNTAYDTTFLVTAGLMGMVSAAFYGWLPLYLPELFPTAVRATGQGFGFNLGRIIAAAGNLQMANLLAFFDNDYARACAMVAGVYLVGLVLIAISPETRGRPLPE
ncbi:MAG: MFS transporter [Gemmataceae bacterium]|nr:MFS transporter [Gemmataceae bacterium]MDW8243566.1 MFS transporter [Thermogemmata sp.]